MISLIFAGICIPANAQQEYVKRFERRFQHDVPGIQHPVVRCVKKGSEVVRLAFGHCYRADGSTHPVFSMYTDKSTYTEDIIVPEDWRIYDFTDMNGIVYFCGKTVGKVVGNDTTYHSLMGFFKLADYPNCDLHFYTNDVFSEFQKMALYRQVDLPHVVMSAKKYNGTATLVDSYSAFNPRTHEPESQRRFFMSLYPSDQFMNDSLSGMTFNSIAVTKDYVIASSTKKESNPLSLGISTSTSQLWFFLRHQGPPATDDFEGDFDNIFAINDITRIRYPHVFNLHVKSFGEETNEFVAFAQEQKSAEFSVDYYDLFRLKKHLSAPYSNSRPIFLKSIVETSWNEKLGEMDVLYWNYLAGRCAGLNGPCETSDYSSHILHLPKTLIEDHSSTVNADEQIFSNYAIWTLTHVRNSASIWGSGCEENPYQDYLLYAFKYTHGHEGNCAQNSSYRLAKSKLERKWTTMRSGAWGYSLREERIFTPQSSKTPIKTICD